MQGVLVPVDHNQASEGALRYASKQCRDSGASMYILRVTRVSPGFQHGLGTAQDSQALRQDSEWLKSKFPDTDGVRFEHHHRTGDPAEQILQFAERYRTGMIIMGTHGRGGPSRRTLGSVAEKVIRNAKCPVITIRDPTSADQYARQFSH